MNMNLKRGIVTGAISLSLLGGSAAGVVAQNPGQGQQVGAGGLVAAVVLVTDTIDITDSIIEVVSVDIRDSLNNLTALNNILNNSPILSNNNIVVVDVVDVGDIDIALLEDANIFIGDVIGVAVLSGGDLIVLT